MSDQRIEPDPMERLLARVLHTGTWIASTAIAVGLLLSLLPARALLLNGSQVVAFGIALFILLPVLRVVLMLVLFLRERDKPLATAAALVLIILFAGFAVGVLSR